MKKLYIVLFSAVLYQTNLKAQTAGSYFTSNPTLTPDGKTVIFSYEGDLWKTDINSPAATRLTAMQGEETNPRVSPDGQWLAFSSNQFGNNDVYVMSLTGGDIKQLTYNDAGDNVDSWTWDSKSIYFNSGRYNGFSEYKEQLPAALLLGCLVIISIPYTALLSIRKPASCFSAIPGRVSISQPVSIIKVLITPIFSHTILKPKLIKNIPTGKAKISGLR
jgi:hypothetical protein